MSNISLHLFQAILRCKLMLFVAHLKLPARTELTTELQEMRATATYYMTTPPYA